MNQFLIIALILCTANFLYAYVTAADDPYEPHYHELSETADTAVPASLCEDCLEDRTAPASCTVSQEPTVFHSSSL